MITKIGGRLLVLATVLFLSGCGSVISPAIQEQVNPYLSFGQVLKDPSSYAGQTVIWSGTIIKTTVGARGTVLEILQHEADSRGMPIHLDRSEGRFLAFDNRFLDPEIYSQGRKVTVAGIIRGSRTRPLGKTEYRYPYLEIKELHLWPREERSACRYNPPYDDWGSPFWWRGFYSLGWCL